MGKRSKFRAMMGKDANKFYAFKNEERGKSFKRTDGLLKVVYRLALTAFLLSLILISVGLGIFILSFVFVIGFTIPLAENPGVRLMEWSFQFVPILLIIYAVVYLLKFILEYLFLFAEMRELRKTSQTDKANQKFIDVGRAVIKSKVIALFAIFTTVAVLVLVGLSMCGEESYFESWYIALFAIIVIALIVNKVMSTKIFLRVQPQINEIRKERGESFEVPKSTE